MAIQAPRRRVPSMMAAAQLVRRGAFSERARPASLASSFEKTCVQSRAAETRAMGGFLLYDLRPSVRPQSAATITNELARRYSFVMSRFGPRHAELEGSRTLPELPERFYTAQGTRSASLDARAKRASQRLPACVDPLGFGFGSLDLRLCVGGASAAFEPSLAPHRRRRCGARAKAIHHAARRAAGRHRAS